MLRILGRAGYLAIGMVYAAVGVIAARVAFLGAQDRVAGMLGALRFILRQAHGVELLWGIAGGLLAFACWRFAEAARRRRRPLERIGFALSGAGYAVLAWTAIALLLRVRAGGGGELRTLEWVLSRPWGPTVLTASGAGILASALHQFHQALSGRLRERFATDLMGRRAARWATRIARAGLAARAVVFVIVGYYVIRAARERDPSQFHEIGGALRLLSKTPLGPVLMGIVALGLLAFAFYMGTLALFRRG